MTVVVALIGGARRRRGRGLAGGLTVGLTVGAGLLAGAGGCAAGGGKGPVIGTALPQPEARSHLLDSAGKAVWRNDLGAAEVALAALADREAGRRDPALDYWSELLALLRCEPLLETPRPLRGEGDGWEQLRRLVQIERVRMQRRLPPARVRPGAGAKAKTGADANANANASPSGGAPRAGARTVVIWPYEAERWPDESPRPAGRPDRCAAAPTDELPASAGTARELPLVAEAAAWLPAAHPARPLLLLDQAVLLIARDDARDAARPIAGVDAAALPAGERGTYAAAAALAAAAAAPTDADTIARLRAALDAGELPPGAQRPLTLALSESLRAAGKGDQAAALVGPPPHGDDAIGRYLAWRQAEAHARAGRRAEALGEAREALGAHDLATVDSDDALAALFALAVRTLLQSPAGDETFETLEALGVPAERLLRVERFADVANTPAGGSGQPAAALAAFLWLAEHDRNPGRELHHLARATIAAARAGNHGEFRRLLGIIAGDGDRQDESPGDVAAGPAAPRRGLAKSQSRTITALPPAAAQAPPPASARGRRPSAWRGRAGRRPADWLRALLVVARDSLDALVDAGDQQGLGALVDSLQQHLTEGGHGPVDAELTVVYRAASAHLDRGARAYAERVGQPRRPILLGEIQLASTREPAAPRGLWVPPEPDTLLFVPRSGGDAGPDNITRWPTPLGPIGRTRSGRP